MKIENIPDENPFKNGFEDTDISEVIENLLQILEYAFADWEQRKAKVDTYMRAIHFDTYNELLMKAKAIGFKENLVTTTNDMIVYLQKSIETSHNLFYAEQNVQRLKSAIESLKMIQKI